MADDQTADFFNSPSLDFSAPPPAGDFTGFAAPPEDDGQIGDVFYGSAPTATDEQTADFFNPPPPTEDAPIILGGYEAPLDASADGMGFASAPSGGSNLIEDVDDDDDAAAAGGSIVPVEQSPMAKWNDEWQQTLLQRKDEENSVKGQHVEKARDDIAAFQAERERKREARMAKNRSDEQDKLEAIEADLENDNSWQRVVKMIELNQDSSDGALDTGRMKDVLVLLKNEPSRAEAVSA